MLQSAHMLRTYLSRSIQKLTALPRWLMFLAAALVLGITFLGGYFLQPITILDNGKVNKVQAAVFTTGQALSSAGVQLDPSDQVQPSVESPVPFNRKIRIRRAVQVTVWENGLLRTVTGQTTEPYTLLRENGIDLGPSDQLLWNGEIVDAIDVLPAGQPVLLQINRAQTIIVDDNGQRQAVTTTAATAARALWEAGVRIAPGDLLSIPPASQPAANAVIAHQSARSLTIRTANQTLRVRSAAKTVGQALADAGVPLQGLDYAQPAEDQPLPEDGTVRVVRVREEITLTETLIPFEQKTEPDPNIELDQRQVTQPGQYGVQVVRERARFEDGQEVSRGHDSDWTASEPVDQIVGAGTKVVGKTLDSPDGAVEYYRAVSVYATSYSPCNLGTDYCSSTTSSGAKLEKGIIAVTLNWYRMLRGHRVYVPGYGFGVIADVGGGISGTPWIDLGFDDASFESGAFVGWTTMYLLMPAPAYVPLVFP